MCSLVILYVFCCIFVIVKVFSNLFFFLVIVINIFLEISVLMLVCFSDFLLYFVYICMVSGKVVERLYNFVFVI